MGAMVPKKTSQEMEDRSIEDSGDFLVDKKTQYDVGIFETLRCIPNCQLRLHMLNVRF